MPWSSTSETTRHDDAKNLSPAAVDRSGPHALGGARRCLGVCGCRGHVALCRSQGRQPLPAVFQERAFPLRCPEGAGGRAGRGTHARGCPQWRHGPRQHAPERQWPGLQSAGRCCSGSQGTPAHRTHQPVLCLPRSRPSHGPRGPAQCGGCGSAQVGDCSRVGLQPAGGVRSRSRGADADHAGHGPRSGRTGRCSGQRGAQAHRSCAERAPRGALSAPAARPFSWAGRSGGGGLQRGAWCRVACGQCRAALCGNAELCAYRHGPVSDLPPRSGRHGGAHGQRGTDSSRPAGRAWACEHDAGFGAEWKSSLCTGHAARSRCARIGPAFPHSRSHRHRGTECHGPDCRPGGCR